MSILGEAVRIIFCGRTQQTALLTLKFEKYQGKKVSNADKQEEPSEGGVCVCSCTFNLDLECSSMPHVLTACTNRGGTFNRHGLVEVTVVCP
jgi:hypothetical protein